MVIVFRKIRQFSLHLTRDSNPGHIGCEASVQPLHHRVNYDDDDDDDDDDDLGEKEREKKRIRVNDSKINAFFIRIVRVNQA